MINELNDLGIYQLTITIYSFLLNIAAKLGYQKANLFIQLRNTQQIKKFQKTHIWIHAASAGEGNQAIPLARVLKNKYDCNVSISFFSPSGFLFHKNSVEFDQVLNLPLDHPKKIKPFINKLNPDAAIFIKKELWWNTLNYLSEKNIPSFLVNASPKSFFTNWILKSYHLKSLKLFDLVFLTNPNGLNYAKQLSLAKIYGDTKFESSFDIDNHSEEIDVKQFCGNNLTIVIGSSWSKEEQFVYKFIKSNQLKRIKIIIAPHEIGIHRIQRIYQMFKELTSVSLYSKIDFESQILIIDEIGKLKSIYKHTDIAIIGGGLGKGIHNILEPIAYCNLVLFGPNYKKFEEANELIEKKLALTFNDYKGFENQLNLVLEDKFRLEIQEKLKHYKASKSSISKNIIKVVMTNLK